MTPKSLIRRRESQYERKGFAGLLTRARLDEGLTQKEMAERLSIPLSTLQKIELGMRPPLGSDIEKCCQYFGWDINEVMALEGAKKQELQAAPTVPTPVTQVIQFPVGPVRINLQVTVSWM